MIKEIAKRIAEVNLIVNQNKNVKYEPKLHENNSIVYV
jgi:hypothetical protein